MTPYEVVYNQPPPIHLPYIPRKTKGEVVDKTMQRREGMIQVLKFYLLRAQNRMKVQADAHRFERAFIVGDWVWLKLHPYKQQSVESTPIQKLGPKYNGPFKVITKVEKVAYTVQLPQGAQTQPIFHVSQLKS